MNLRASKDHCEPAHTHMLIDASAFLSVSTAYVYGVFNCIYVFLVLNQTNMRAIKEENI